MAPAPPSTSKTSFGKKKFTHRTSWLCSRMAPFTINVICASFAWAAATSIAILPPARCCARTFPLLTLHEDASAGWSKILESVFAVFESHVRLARLFMILSTLWNKYLLATTTSHLRQHGMLRVLSVMACSTWNRKSMESAGGSTCKRVIFCILCEIPDSIHVEVPSGCTTDTYEKAKNLPHNLWQVEKIQKILLFCVDFVPSKVDVSLEARTRKRSPSVAHIFLNEVSSPSTLPQTTK